MEDTAHDALGIDHASRVTRSRGPPSGDGCVGGAVAHVPQVADIAWGRAATHDPDARRTPTKRCADATLSWSGDRQIATINGTRWLIDQSTQELLHSPR